MNILHFTEKEKILVADGEEKIINGNINLGETNAKYLKIKIDRFGIIPDGAQGAGHEAWLFVDEIIVE